MKTNINIAFLGLTACCLALITAYLWAPEAPHAGRIGASAYMVAIGIACTAILSLLLSSLNRLTPTSDNSISVLDAWEAIGHDAGVNPSKEELLDSLRNMSHLVEILSTATNPAVDQVLAERIRQIQKHGYGGDYDDEHDKGELLDASICYAIEAQVVTDDSSHISDIVPIQWPWDAESWKPGTPHRMLVKALALGVAELERQIRAEQRATEAPSND